MKKKFICLMVLLGILYSCQKSDHLSADPKKDILSTVERISSASDYEEQQQIFNLMSPCERYALWKKHLDTARAQFLQNGSNQKVALIDQLYPYLSCSTFDENSNSSSILLNYVLPTWLENAKEVFTPMELYDITTDPTEDNIGSRTAPPDIGTPPGGGGGTPCWCNVGTTGFSCTTMQFVFGLPPRWEIKSGICYQKTDCVSTRMGCGFLWLSNCNGNSCQYT